MNADDECVWCGYGWPPLARTTHTEWCQRVREAVRTRQTWTHCGKGHEFTEANTYIRPNGKRRCRECGREWSRQHARRVKRRAAGSHG